MPHETEILANESGIQYTGVNDASSVTGDYPIQGLMIGIFKRGRFDRPMTIHKGNIKAMLGFEPKNPYYLAVQDALDSGVPSVQVLRLEPKTPGGDLAGGVAGISCAGATSYVAIKNYYMSSDGNVKNNGSSAHFSFNVNGVIYNPTKALEHWDVPLLSDVLNVMLDSGGNLTISAVGSQELRVIMSPSQDQKKYSTGFESGDNPTGSVAPNGDLYFCLANSLE